MKSYLMSAWIDLARYPIDRLASAAGRALLRRCHDALDTHGIVALPGFVTAAATTHMLAQSERLQKASRGFHSSEKHNIFLTDEAPPPGLGPSHPQLQQMSSSKLIFAADELSEATPLHEIHAWPPMLHFVQAALRQEQIYPSACPLGRFYINVFSPGDQLGWHFDNSEFSINLMLQPAVEGGAFEYAPRTREAIEAMDTFPPADSVGEHVTVLSPPLVSSSLYLFYGRNSLHRVSRIEEGKRVNAILSYNSRPNERLHEYTLRKFFGRCEALPSDA
ncbi:hypothetical protein AB1Y20_000732 [Prymnesium parvum]|uniref:Fe2OG dioxygenase domain-containing protein n=1 Tax=Prymnesium parvum TaxID=97485 RepID=A0AB34K6A7_PRYPA